LAGDIFDDLLGEAASGGIAPAKPVEDPIFQDLLGEAETTAKRERSLAVMRSMQGDPEQYDKRKLLATSFDVPVDFAARNEKRLEQFKGFQDTERLFENNGKLASFFVKDDNASAVKIDELRHLDGLAWFYSATKQGLSAGQDDVNLATLRYKQMMGTASGDEIARADLLSAGREPRTYGADSWLEQGWVGTMGQLPIMAETFLSGIEGGFKGATYGAAIALAGGQAGPQIALPEEVLTVPTGMALGYKMGSAGGQAIAAFRLEGGLAYDEFKSLRDENGKLIDDDVARGAAMVAGSANAILETISFRKMAQIVPGVDKLAGTITRDAIRKALTRPTVRMALSDFVKNSARAGATEVTTELMQEAITIFAGEAAKAVAGEDGADFTMMTGGEFGDRMSDTFVQTLQTMTILGPALATTRLGHDVRRASQSQRDMAVIEALSTHAEGNELNARLPEKAKEAIRTLTEGGPVEHVYIDPKALSEFFQTSEEASKFAAATGLTDEYNEAQRTGRDMEVPIDTYYVNIAGTEIGAAIKEFVKLSPDSMNANEAIRFNEAWQEAVDELRSEYEAGAAEDKVALEGEERVFEDVKQKAVDAGMVPDQATQYAKLYSTFFRVMAQRSGQDAGELYATYGLDVKRALPGETAYKAVDNLDLALEVLRAGKVDALRKTVEKASGPSLLQAIIARGGIIDTGGELAGMDVPKGLIRKSGGTDAGTVDMLDPTDAPVDLGDFNQFGADDTMRAMWDEGYFPEFEERPTADDLYSAIREEAAGRKRFSGDYSKLDDPRTQQAAGLVALADMLDQAGIDPATATNEEIRAEIDKLVNADPETGAMFQRGFGVVTPSVYPMAGDAVDGLTVRDEVPNMSSISATLEDYTVLKGVREIPFADMNDGAFDGSGATKRVRDLAASIQESGEINPLIVVLEKAGPYILEGAHRVDALQLLGKRTFPAIVVVDESEGTGLEIWKDDPKPARDNDPRQRELFQDVRTEDGALFAVHNIKPNGLLNAIKLGGIPMPSLAITKAEDGFDSYGEISLIASPNLVNPKMDRDVVVGNADLYSPRYPSVHYDVDYDEFERFNKALLDAGAEYGLTDRDAVDMSKLEDRGPGEAAYSVALRLEWLKDQGREPEIVRNEDGTPHWSENRKAIDEAVGWHNAEYADWAFNRLTPLVKRERIFKGFTHSGNRRYVPHTLEAVVKDMKARMKEGEGFNYGAGNIRSKAAKRFKSLDAIQADREKVVSPDAVKALKDEFNDRLFALGEAAREFYKFDGGGFRYMDDFADMLSEMPTKGERVLREGFDDLPAEVIADIKQYLADLRDAPTEYFEAKFTRAVFLEEFAGALIPEGTSKAVRDALGKAGLEIVEYGKEEGAKRDALQKFERVFFQQNEVETGATKPGVKRGSIQLGEGRTIINLFDQADMSTFLHESGHFFLEVFKDLAAAPNAPAELLTDWAVTQEYLGLKPGQEITVDAHERFARTFEAYLFEGKAPSAEVAGIMARFRSWLVFVYKSVSALRVPMNDKIRGVMDRMIATDEEIKAAQAGPEFKPAFKSAEEAGMSDKQWAGYVEQAGRAVERTRRDLEIRMMEEVSRETTKEWRDAKKEIQAAVRKEMEALPVYRVLNYLRTGVGENVPAERMWLDRGAILDMMGEGALIKLPKGVPPIYRAKGGVHPDTMAELFGFKSGHDMLTRMMSVPAMGKAVVDETNLRMKQRYGDLMGDAMARAREVTAAIANDATGDLLAAELGVLVKKGLATSSVSKEQARATARLMVRSKTIREALRVKLYMNANAKAAEEAERAIRKQDWKAALEAKKRQLLNHYMAMEAREAEKEVEAAVRYLNKFGGRKRVKGVWATHLDQIESLMERFDLRKSVTLKDEQRRTSLGDWIAEQEALGELVVLPDVVRNDAFRKPYRQMTVDDLLAVRDAVKNLEHLGRRWAKVYGDIEAREHRAKVDELTASIEKSQKLRKGDRTRNPTKLQDILAMGRSLEATLLKMEGVFEWMDGGKPHGPFRRMIWDRLAKAEERENDMRVKIVGEFQRIMGRLDHKRLNEHVSIPGLAQTYRRSDIMAVALNMGNESNMDKLMRGEGWSKAMLDSVVSHLNAEEATAVQGIWDVIEGLWPEIAAIQKRLTGVEPPKVVASKVTIAGVELAGGYYPMIYDPRRSADVQDRGAAAADRLFENTYLRPETRHGFTKERAQAYTRPLLLDIDGAGRHLTAVIHDVTHREAILDSYKLLTDPKIRGAIEARYSRELYQQMVPWLQSIAHDAYKDDGLQAVERLFRGVRSRATIMGMGFRISTMIMQVAGLSSSLEMVNMKHMAGALKDFTMSPRAMWQEVNRKSGQMRYRSANMDRDINERVKALTGKQDKISQAQKFAFYGIGFMDRVVTVPTWTAAYREYLAREPGDEAGAISHADKVVSMTQGSGGAKDLAAVQRRNELTKLVTMFYSYFSAYYNRQRAWGRDVRRKIKTGEGSFASLLARQVFMTVGPALLTELIVGRGPDDDTGWAEWAAKKVLFYPTAAVPIVRDAFGVFDRGFGYSFTPAARAIDELLVQPFQMIGDIWDGEAEPRKIVKQTIETTGYALALPVGQVASSVDNVWKAIEDDDFQLRDLVLTRPKK
jgi:hypothetical protein